MLKGLTILGASLIVATGFIVGALIVSDNYAHQKTVTVMSPAVNMTSGTMMGSANAGATPAAISASRCCTPIPASATRPRPCGSRSGPRS